MPWWIFYSACLNWCLTDVFAYCNSGLRELLSPYCSIINPIYQFYAHEYFLKISHIQIQNQKLKSEIDRSHTKMSLLIHFFFWGKILVIVKNRNFESTVCIARTIVLWKLKLGGAHTPK